MGNELSFGVPIEEYRKNKDRNDFFGRPIWIF
jgi:hypothetical protein